MSQVWVGCVVEGKGDVEGLPVLLRRIGTQLDPGLVVEVPRPVRMQRSRIGEQFGDLARAIEQAVAPLRAPSGLFILVDADDDADCPKTLCPALLERARAVRGDLPLAVVLAKREYETWFLAAAESLRGKRGLPLDLEPPPNPEEIRGAKEWLRKRAQTNRKYSPTGDQAALTAVFDMDLARSRSDSFDKCYREIARLLTLLQGPPPPPPSGPQTEPP